MSSAGGAPAAFHQARCDIVGALTCHSSTVAMGSAAQPHAQLHLPPAAAPTMHQGSPWQGGLRHGRDECAMAGQWSHRP